MKSTIARLLGPTDLRWEELAVAEPGQGELLCETLVSGISVGTEGAAYRGDPPLRPGPIYPRLVGYLNISRVLECGPGANRFTLGDTVLTLQCHQSLFTISEAEVLASVPESVPLASASLAYLAQIGLDSLRRVDFRPGESVAVVGLGVIGLATVATAVACGAEVFAIGNDPGRQEIAVRLGARKAWGHDDPGLLEEILGCTGGFGSDIVVTTSNTWDGWKLALKLPRMRGRIAVLGFPGRGQPPSDWNPLDSAYFYDRQLSIFGCGHSLRSLVDRTDIAFNLNRNIEVLFEWMGSGRLSLDELVTHRVAWHQLEDIYRRIEQKDRSLIGAVLEWKS